MSATNETVETAQEMAQFVDARPPLPGAVLLWADGKPTCRAVPIRKMLSIGRSPDAGLSILDSSVSTRHLEVAHDGARWTLHDLGSSNGTFVDGAPLPPKEPRTTADARLLRLGRAFVLLVDDVRPFLDDPRENLR